MELGKLFLNLGVNGADKTIGTLGQGQKAFKQTAGLALEAKAAIVGAIYALQALFRTSNQAGSDLQNFNAALGISAKTLQQYQYAARQVGVDNKAVEQSFRTLQTAMTKILMGQDAPAGMARVAEVTGWFDPRDIKAFTERPELLIQRLQEYAKNETRGQAFLAETLRTFGLGEDMIAALSREAFTPERLAKAPVYSENEIAALDRANAAWANLGNTIEMAIGRLNVKYGDELVGGLTRITESVFKLVDALGKLGDKLKVLDALKSTFDGLTFITDTASTISEIVSTKGESLRDEKKAKKIDDASNKFLKENDFFRAYYKILFGREATDEMIKKAKDALQKAREEYPENSNRPETLEESQRRLEANPLYRGSESAPPPSIPNMPPVKEIVTPKYPPAAVNNTTQTQNFTVNQTLTFPNSGAPDDPERVKRIHAEAVQRALRQLPSQSRSN